MEGTNNLITEEMKEYDPSVQDLFITIKNGDYQRLVWGDEIDLREREEDHWEKFEEYIAEKGLDPLPEYYTTSERIGFRFLQGCGWNYEAAYNGILEN